MVIFKDVDALSDASERTRRFLSDAKQQYQRRRDSVKKQVQLVHSAHDRLKSDLARNETAKTLEGLEQKLRHYEQNIFQEMNTLKRSLVRQISLGFKGRLRLSLRRN